MTGLDFNAALGKLRAGTVKGVNEAAMVLQAQAIPLTPFKTGALRNSSYVDAANSLRDGAAEAAVRYNTVYAAYQHEKAPNKVHPGTTMKYLETPMNDPQVQAHIKATILRHIEGQF